MEPVKTEVVKQGVKLKLACSPAAVVAIRQEDCVKREDLQTIFDSFSNPDSSIVRSPVSSTSSLPRCTTLERGLCGFSGI